MTTTPDAGPRIPSQLVLLLVLTFTTGIVDAVGYLGLDRVFIANMTGNVVILGMALAGGDDLPVAGPLLALGAFFAGALLGGRLTNAAPRDWARASTIAFAVTGTVATVLGVAAMIEPPSEGTPWGFTVTGVLAVAMGLQAAAARRIAVKDVTTVVVTSTLTGLAADSRLAQGSGENWARRLLAVVLILAGAAFGALLLNLAGSAGVGLGMLVAGVGSLAVTVVGHLRHR
ncbi:YoaK family protein [Myceligenerans pegani]|uniref:YoaK family protein n=1 Tax=Myceligenerans pegani TaxID=2776917 RepID=UPI00299EBD2B|nr:YoaK family protein [Myceligenerans sp. TRM 65318]